MRSTLIPLVTAVLLLSSCGGSRVQILIPGADARTVEWSDKESADAATAKVQADPAFAPYMAAITGVTLMQHFSTTDTI